MRRQALRIEACGARRDQGWVARRAGLDTGPEGRSEVSEIRNEIRSTAHGQMFT